MLNPLFGHEIEVGLFEAEHRLRFEISMMTGRSMVVVRTVIVMMHIAVIIVITEIGPIRPSIVTARVMTGIVAVEHRIVFV